MEDKSLRAFIAVLFYFLFIATIMMVGVKLMGMEYVTAQNSVSHSLLLLLLYEVWRK